MGAEADANEPTTTVGGPAAHQGKGSDGVEKKMSMRSGSTAKGSSAPNRGVADDDIATTLAAASEKLQAAHRAEQKKRKSGLSRCLGALYPKKFFSKLRDYYINTCMMAADKGDFADLVAGHPGMYYGDSVMSRNISLRRDREHEEILQASLSRQVSISLSRQQSKSFSGPLKMTRNTSTGFSGISRSGSTGMSEFSRQASTGTGRSTFGMNISTSSRKSGESNLFSAGRNTFMKQHNVSNVGRINPFSLDDVNNTSSVPKPEVSKAGQQEPSVPSAVAGKPR